MDTHLIMILDKIKNKDMYWIVEFVNRLYLFKKTKYFYSFFLKSVGKSSYIAKPLYLKGLGYIEIGCNVAVYKNCRIEIIDQYGDQKFVPRFSIGDYTQIHQNAHITCAGSIKIGKNVVIASNVTITDIIHQYTDIATPINWQRIELAPVEIGDQSYVYNNCVIVPGVKIGRHCIIGANSVVTNNVPDYCLAAGNPTRIVRKFSMDKNIWEKV